MCVYGITCARVTGCMCTHVAVSTRMCVRDHMYMCDRVCEHMYVYGITCAHVARCMCIHVAMSIRMCMGSCVHVWPGVCARVWL